MDKKTVLIVEDKDEFRKIYSDRLRFSGYHVLDAADGDEALVVLAKNKVDLVVTDLNMPHRDGYELISYMKSDKDLKDIPIIVMSVFDQGEHLTKAIKLGAVDYIVKGKYPPLEVLKKINAVTGVKNEPPKQ